MSVGDGPAPKRSFNPMEYLEPKMAGMALDERQAVRASRARRRAVVRNVGDALFVAAVAVPCFALFGVALVLSASAAGWM